MRERGHVHDFERRKRFIDGCHYIVIEQTCRECGVVETGVERNFHLNPPQIAFARQDCARCRELTAGIEPASWGVSRSCSECGCDLTDQESTRCSICYGRDLADAY